MTNDDKPESHVVAVPGKQPSSRLVDTQGVDLNHARILIVEDDYLQAFDLRDELTLRGADVVGPAGSLDAATELVRSEQAFDVAIIDINLHGEFAFPLVDELIRLDVTVAFSSGYDAEVLPYRLRHIPQFHKPVRPNEIARGIYNLLSESKPLVDQQS